MVQDKYSSFGQGLTQGLSLVANMDQMKQQREQRQWENDYKMSAAALELGSKESLPAAMRMNAINNGFIPVWNKYKPMAQMEPVTEADFGNNDLRQVWNQASKIIGDKKMDPSMQMEAITNLFGDFHVKRGQVKEVQDLAMKLVSGDVVGDERRARTDFYKARADDVAEQQEERSVRREEREQARYRNYFLDLEQRDPIIKEVNKQDLSLNSVNALAGLVSDGNTVAFSGLGTKMARGMGEVGVLTEQDIKRYVMSGRLDRKAADTLSKWIRGAPTDATQEEIGQIVNVMRDTFQQKIQPRYDQFIKTYANIEKISPEEFANKIRLPYSGGGQSSAQPAQPGAGGNRPPLSSFEGK